MRAPRQSVTRWTAGHSARAFPRTAHRYTLGTKGQVRFIARKRVGADVTHADRFVKLRVAA